MNSFSPEWIFSFSFRASCGANFFLQKVQLNSFSSIWIFSFSFRTSFMTNFFLQKEQLNGFSSVRIFSFYFRLSIRTNFFQQLNGFSPEWILSCSFRSSIRTNFAFLGILKYFAPIMTLPHELIGRIFLVYCAECLRVPHTFQEKAFGGHQSHYVIPLLQWCKSGQFLLIFTMFCDLLLL